MKRLVVNADDFGFTSDVNAGILRSYLRGIVSSASLMANGRAFEDAAAIARQHPGLGVGCHLTLVQGKSLAEPGAELPPTLARLLADLPDQASIEAEFRAQVSALVERGMRPTHLDTHKHLHVLPPVLEAVIRVAEEFGIRWIRRPFDMPHGMRPGLRSAASLLLRPLAMPFAERLAVSRCRSTDYFAGFMATGALEAGWLTSLLDALPEGTGEFVCHPGLCGDELRRADTRLKESREAELEALCSPSVKRAAHRNGIRLVSYRELSV